ncbi:Eukaryotic membrane protein family [Plasmodiophora brassicae]
MSADGWASFMQRLVVGGGDGRSAARFHDGQEQPGSRRRRVYRMLITWTKLEPLMAFGIILCIDALLGILCLTPVRAMAAILRRMASRRKQPLKVGEQRDVLVTFLLFSVIVVLHLAGLALDVSYSHTYHIIRRQGYFRVFVLFNIVNVLDRLCSMFGGDLFASAIETRASRSATRAACDVALCIAYAVVHVAVIYAQVVTLNVAVNSDQAELIVILTSSNFSELKGSVLKKFSVINVFQIAMGDVVERFQTFAVLLMISAHQFSAMDRADYAEFGGRILLVVVWMSTFEIMVDWMKHGFINRFNDLSPHIYSEFSAILSHDVITNPDVIPKRIGLVPLPLASIIARGILQILWRKHFRFWMFYTHQIRGLSIACLVLLVSCLLLVKVMLRVLLIGASTRRMRRYGSSIDAQMWSGVERYKLNSKSLPVY